MDRRPWPRCGRLHRTRRGLCHRRLEWIGCTAQWMRGRRLRCCRGIGERRGPRRHRGRCRGSRRRERIGCALSGSAVTQSCGRRRWASMVLAGPLASRPSLRRGTGVQGIHYASGVTTYRTARRHRWRAGALNGAPPAGAPNQSARARRAAGSTAGSPAPAGKSCVERLERGAPWYAPHRRSVMSYGRGRDTVRT